MINFSLILSSLIYINSPITDSVYERILWAEIHSEWMEMVDYHQSQGDTQGSEQWRWKQADNSPTRLINALDIQFSGKIWEEQSYYILRSEIFIQLSQPLFDTRNWLFTRMCNIWCRTAVRTAGMERYAPGIITDVMYAICKWYWTEGRGYDEWRMSGVRLQLKCRVNAIGCTRNNNIHISWFLPFNFII